MSGQEEPELQEVFASIDALQVQMARDQLDSSGIQTFVFDGESSRMLGTTAAVPTRLMVAAPDAAEALDRLKELGFID